jgi:hypothetical protein
MATHLQLWAVCRAQTSYRDGTDTKNHERPDCSSGCKHFHKLQGREGSDWGVCTEPKSPRAGLLTFEHMGCLFFEKDVVPTANASDLRIGSEVRGRSSGKRGVVTAVRISGVEVRFEDNTSNFLHPHLHLQSKDGLEFSGPWWDPSKEEQAEP